jgi:hypothetical protein
VPLRCPFVNGREQVLQVEAVAVLTLRPSAGG